jgi:hypothetical protein
MPRHLPPCLLAICAGAAAAADTATAVAPAEGASAAAPAASAAAQSIRVIEDDNVRIEETRIRGQLTRVVVRSKLPGSKPYEIIVGPGGQDPSQDHGARGQSAWPMFSF